MNRILLALAVLAAAVGGAAYLGAFKLPAPAFFAVAGVLALVLVLRLLPLKVRRPVVFALTFVILAGLGGGLYYFHFDIKPGIIKGAISAAMAPKPQAVSVEPVKIEQWARRLPAIGTTRAFQSIDVAPQVAGVITAIHFHSGEDVAAGAPLLEIDDSVDQADLKNGLAQLKNAEISLERQQTLVVGGNTAKAQVDAATAARDSAAATVERTRAIIAQKKIVAPFAGRLGISKVDVGQFLSVGSSIVTLQELDPMYVDFQSPEQSLRDLAVGQEARTVLDAFPGQPFVGKIHAIDARVSQDTRNVLVRAEFANPDHKLLPGMFANIEVTTGAPADVLTLPRTAIVYSLYGDNVFVVKRAPPKAPKQIELSENRIANMLAAKPDIDPIVAKLPEGYGAPDANSLPQLDEAAKKHGLADYADYLSVKDNVALTMAGVDPQTRQYVGDKVALKQKIASVEGDQKLAANEKEETLALLNAALGSIVPLQFSANIPLVLKHYDKLSEAALIDDRKDRIVERRFVRLGETRGERVAIAEGAIAGERVVTAGQIKLQPNSPVMIDNANALPPPAQTPKS
ncbi:MAG: efflux RND transporter periplasmic adaptor subunit [Roseiarcus sp.]